MPAVWMREPFWGTMGPALPRPVPAVGLSVSCPAQLQHFSTDDGSRACSVNVKDTLENDRQAYYSMDELQHPLRVMYDSLMETKDDCIAHGRLLDAMRQVGGREQVCFHCKV